MTPSDAARTEAEDVEKRNQSISEDISPSMAETPVDRESPVTTSRPHSMFDSIAKTETDVTLTATTPTTAYEKTSLEEDASQTASRPQRPRDPRMPIRESLGLEGVSIVMGGMVGILGGLAFLTFLWFGHGSQAEAANATWVWRQLALRGYMTQAITLTSLVLCFAVGLQTTVCTSMIASLVLERRATRKTQVASMSVLRAINDGPRRVVGLLLRSRSSRVFLHLEFWLIVLLGVVSASLQFISTILLTDVQDFTVVGDLRDVQVASLLPQNVSSDDVRETLGLMSYYPGDTTFPIYSEALESQENPSLLPNERGLSDTGLKQKGLLPLGTSDERTAARHYQGNAMVLNSRTACMAPTLRGHLSPQNWTAPSADGGETVSAYGFVEGALDYSASLVNAGVEGAGVYDVAYFECGIAGSNFVGSGPGSYEATFCLVDGVGGSMWVIDEDSDMKSFWGTDDPPWSEKNPIFLMLATTMNNDDWLLVANSSEDHPLPEGSPYGEWQSYETLPGKFVNISLCFPAFNVERHEVRMDTEETALREPGLTWSVSSPHYNTASLRTYLGLDHPISSPGSRGIMDLSILGPPVAGNATPTNAAYSETVDLLTPKLLEMVIHFTMTDEEGLNNTFTACWDCNIDWTFLYGDWMIVFADIIQYTGRAASVFDAYVSMIAFTAYQEILTTGAVAAAAAAASNETVRLASIRTTQAPLRCAATARGCPGYAAAAVLLAAHLAVVAVITALYVRRARYSRVASIWPAVAQLVSGELGAVLEGATERGDGEVERAAAGRGEDAWVRLARSPDGERVSVVALGEQDRLRKPRRAA